MWGEIIVQLPCSLSNRLSTDKGIRRMQHWQKHMPKMRFSPHNRSGKFRLFQLHSSKHKKKRKWGAEGMEGMKKGRKGKREEGKG